MSLQIKTYSAIVSSMLTAIGQRTGLTNFNVGSVVRTLSEVYSEVVAELYAFGAEMLKQGFLDTATGVWLDRKAREFNLTRKSALKTQGAVIYSRKVGRGTNVVIPEGSIVTIPKDSSGNEYRYFTTEERILTSGQTSVAVPVIAESVGSVYNVGASSITRMTTFIAGVDSVSNSTDWITVAGVDEESDADLRQRCFLAWNELSQGGTANAYVSWALSSPGVTSAYVDDTQPRGDGTVDVYILDASGPPEEGGALILAVQELIDQKRPITVDVLVKAPSTVTISYSVVVTPSVGYDEETMESAIRSRMRIKFGDEEDAEGLGISALGAGKDVVLSQIIHLAMGVEGVYDVSIASMTISRDGAEDQTIAPAEDVRVDAGEFPELGTLTITFTTPSAE